MKVIRFSNLQFIPASHENPIDPGVLKKVLIKNGDLPKGEIKMINWAKVPVGKSHTPHSHESMIEVFIVIKGQMQVIIDQEEEILNVGDTVIVPIKSMHTVKNLTDQEVEYFALGLATLN